MLRLTCAIVTQMPKENPKLVRILNEFGQVVQEFEISAPSVVGEQAADPHLHAISAAWDSKAADANDKLRDAFKHLLTLPAPDQKRAEWVRSFWVEKGFFGMRERLGADSLWLDALRYLRPPYVGPALTLYRGELVDRYKAGVYGFAWTDRIEVASYFAWRFEHLKEGPGVVLKIDAVPEMILATPIKRSGAFQEREWIVDLGLMKQPTVVPRLPFDGIFAGG